MCNNYTYMFTYYIRASKSMWVNSKSINLLPKCSSYLIYTE